MLSHLDSRLFGEVAEDCNVSSLRLWLEKHRGPRTSEQAIAEEITTRHLYIDRNDRAGWLKITVAITCRRTWKSEVYFYRYDRTAEASWRLAKVGAKQ